MTHDRRSVIETPRWDRLLALGFCAASWACIGAVVLSFHVL